MKGAFIVSRDIFENSIWDDVQKFRIFLFILGNAVFKEEGVRKSSVHIKRGQYLRSYRNLQRDLEYLENRTVKKYSLSTLKRKISKLVEEERLKIEETELGTLFTVVNYDRYQVLDNYKKEHGTALERQENTNETPKEQRENNKKYVKKEKKVKNGKNKDNSRQSAKRTYDENSIHYQLASSLFKEIQNNNSEARPPNLQTWSDDIRKMIELDGRKPEQVTNMIHWCQSHDFWSGIILSGKKLRDKYDQMRIQALNDSKPNNKKQYSKPPTRKETIPENILNPDTTETPMSEEEKAEFMERLEKIQSFGKD